jgi:hypothetical protein
LLLPRSVRACINGLDNLLAEDITIQSKGSSTLVVAFAGMAGIRKTMTRLKRKIGVETRPFEFVHSLQDKECDVLFLRDRHRAYYQSGVRGAGSSVDEVAQFIRSFISQGKYDKVVTLGHSMGGYAAILFASKINADICLAISALSFLDPGNRLKYGDNRYAHEKQRLWEARKESSAYFDLRSYFGSKAHTEDKDCCSYFLFYGENDRLDRIHAERMTAAGYRVNVFEIAGGDHNTARTMRESGMLSRMCDNIVAPNGTSAGSLRELIEREGLVRRVTPARKLT